LETAKADASKALEEVKAAEKALSSMSPARFVGPSRDLEALAGEFFSTMGESLKASEDAESAGKRASSQLAESSRLLRDLDSRIRTLRQLEQNRNPEEVNPSANAGDELKTLESVKATTGAVKQLLLSDSAAYPRIRRNLEMSAQVSQVNQRLLDAVARSSEQSRTRLSSAYKDQEETVRSLNRLVRATGMEILTLGLGATLVGLVYGINLFLGIARPISEYNAILERFGAGDFNVRMDPRRKNEFGLMAHHFNSAAAAIGSLIGQLVGSSDSLAESASKLTAAANTVHEDAAGVSRLIERTALNAARTREKMKSAQALGATANATMLELAASAKVTAEAGKAAEKIIRTINEIAFKTNLLSLNAAVEAARAGAAGAGFEVVAGAVRSLSAQSSEAAQATAKLIGEIVGNTHRGRELAEATRNAFAQLSQLTTDVDALIEEIAICSQSQESQIRKINQGASGLQGISGRNAAAASEISSSVGRFYGSVRRSKKAAKR
jgi:methyl-accepting chemotaxis protein